MTSPETNMYYYGCDRWRIQEFPYGELTRKALRQPNILHSWKLVKMKEFEPKKACVLRQYEISFAIAFD